MKTPLFVCAILLFALTATAFADSGLVDPRVIIDTGGGTVALLGPQVTFPLTEPFCDGGPDTGWTCVFMNATGMNWSQIDLLIDPPQPPLECEAKAYFATCIPDEQGGFHIVFTDGLVQTCAYTRNGENACGQEFALIFSKEFNPDTQVHIEATEVPAVPEPATMALVGSGAVALLRRRRRVS